MFAFVRASTLIQEVKITSGNSISTVVFEESINIVFID
jgi:hypothetical protein